MHGLLLFLVAEVIEGCFNCLQVLHSGSGGDRHAGWPVVLQRMCIALFGSESVTKAFLADSFTKFAG